ncbi:hypothetical protein VNO80_29410 [Phaseolus coccineus]|uniref:Uncharacterized protein n=1 Tax=Phaseolus coccineus TaxID=3886 RepID=A0AAN9LAT7_PHACN
MRGLANVPDSHQVIFRDKKLSLKEKNQLMRLFKLVQQHLDEYCSDHFPVNLLCESFDPARREALLKFVKHDNGSLREKGDEEETDNGKWVKSRESKGWEGGRKESTNCEGMAEV